MLSVVSPGTFQGITRYKKNSSAGELMKPVYRLLPLKTNSIT